MIGLVQEGDVDEYIDFVEVLLGLLSLLKRPLEVKKSVLHPAAVLG